MADQELRDRNNRLIGKIRTRSDGKLELRDPFDFFKGIYDPKTNETRDKDSMFVGKGNFAIGRLRGTEQFNRAF